MKTLTKSERLKGLLFGLAVGDAMGVPFEFMQPKQIESEQFLKMKGFGTYNQPPGSFSDDTSMTVCLIESLINKFSQKETADLFIKWKNENYWTANNETFDIGITTNIALVNIGNGVPIDKAAPRDERSCGNGALMRILPLAFYIDDLTLEEAYDIIVKYACITHGHIRSHMACFYLVLFANRLLKTENNKFECFKKTTFEVKNFFNSKDDFQNEIIHFERLFNYFPNELKDIKNTGYVINSLELTLNMFLKYDSYENVVINIIKAGGDTDTNACISGGLIGLYNGFIDIPQDWLKDLLRKDDFEKLYQEWSESLYLI
jgi:ADP-ribosyl-[dinitrogen reductase] hydrolase